MPVIDIVVLVVTILIVASIIFFSFIFPRIKGENPTCSSCPTHKKGKRLLKEYRKSQKEKQND